MAAIDTYGVVGKKENISDIITNISPTKTPFQTMVKDESVHNVTFQWQEDSLIAAGANAQAESANAPTEVFQATVMRSANTQILAKKAFASGTSDSVTSYGRGKELAYQLGMRAAELKRDLEFAYLASTTIGTIASSGSARFMQGLMQQITLTGGSQPVSLNSVTATTAGVLAQTGSTSAAITEAMIMAVAQQLYINGVDPDTLMVKPADAARIAAFATATGRTRFLDQSSGARKIVNTITTYESPFGTLKVVMNRFQRISEAYLMETDMIRQVVLRPWFKTTLAVTGDATPVSITGEYGLRHRNWLATGMITGLGA